MFVRGTELKRLDNQSSDNEGWTVSCARKTWTPTHSCTWYCVHKLPSKSHFSKIEHHFTSLLLVVMCHACSYSTHAVDILIRLLCLFQMSGSDILGKEHQIVMHFHLWAWRVLPVELRKLLDEFPTWMQNGQYSVLLSLWFQCMKRHPLVEPYTMYYICCTAMY